MKHKGACLSKHHKFRERELIKYKSTYQAYSISYPVLSTGWLSVSMTSTSTRSQRMCAQQAQRPCGKSVSNIHKDLLFGNTSIKLCACLQSYNTVFSCSLYRFCNQPSSTLRFVDNVLSFERPGIGVIITYMAVEGVFFFILTLLIEVPANL